MKELIKKAIELVPTVKLEDILKLNVFDERIKFVYMRHKLRCERLKYIKPMFILPKDSKFIPGLPP